MDTALRVGAVALGACLVIAALVSAIKTVVLPRATVSVVTRWVFVGVQHTFRATRSTPLCPSTSGTGGWRGTPRSACIATLVTWLPLTLAGFTLIFWGVEHISVRSAFVESGSALLTLGLTRPGSLPGVSLAFIEAGDRAVPPGALRSRTCRASTRRSPGGSSA